MKPHQGSYSIVQYCPSASRMEVVNIGILLFCKEPYFLDVKLDYSNRRINKLLSHIKLNFTNESIHSAKKAFQYRIQKMSQSQVDNSELTHFIETRANEIKLTSLYSLSIYDEFQKELDELYDVLVDSCKKKAPRNRTSLKKQLSMIFKGNNFKDRIKFDLEVQIPVVNKPTKIPFAYRNGSINLLKPETFSDPDSVKDRALKLACIGDLFHHYTIDGIQYELILITEFNESITLTDQNAVLSLFKQKEIPVFQSSNTKSLADTVEKEAHLWTE